jgi:hypothetical protein
MPLYIGLALAGLAVMTLLVALSIRFRMTGHITGGWIGFVGYTGLLFWVVVRNTRGTGIVGIFGLLAWVCL